ncbi:MAG: MFS transporter [Actinobacteria bacterium]|nr:MFS transporter [Actinomycetota bacterium]
MKKFLAIAAIALIAFNLRTAVSSVSPVISFIQQEIPLPIITIGLLGIAAPLAFSLATQLSYRPARKIGVENTLMLTIVMIILGHALRAFAWDAGSLFAGSLFALLGMGIGNVLLPVMVRKYFPNRVGAVTSFYITLTAISATLGSLVAVPVAEAAGWRFSLGQWALFSFLAALPLISLLRNSSPEPKPETDEGAKAIWRAPTAWAIAGMQAMTSVFGYVSFAWLPLLLVEHNSVSVAEGGLLLSLFALMGLPTSIFVPIIANRFPAAQVWIVIFSGVMGAGGILGLLFAGNSWLWFFVVMAGFGPTMFPLALTLFNLRSEKRSTVLAVSAFGQGLSYGTASLAVITVGVMRELTGGWEAALWLMFGFAMLSIPVALQISKRNSIDSELR